MIKKHLLKKIAVFNKIDPDFMDTLYIEINYVGKIILVKNIMQWIENSLCSFKNPSKLSFN